MESSINLRTCAQARATLEHKTDSEAAGELFSNQRQLSDFATGLNTTSFCVAKVQQVEGLAVKLTIDLHCNITATPWCIEHRV